MKLDRLVLVNWGQLSPGNYPMSNMTMLTGPTGAGKSTMLDGLQTVMTAAHQSIVAYNPGQEEVQQGQRRGKTKRTLESFIVGAEYSKFSRPDGAQAYLAAVFRPDKGDSLARPFTALVAASARVEGTGERRSAKLERMELVIVDDEALTVEDFLKDASSQEWVAVDDIVKRLKAKYRKVTTYDSHKRDYLCGLYGRFRGRNSVTWEETQNAAKAWCQSIAYRPIGSVHDLVRDDILEFDGKQLQESISRIGDLMRQVTNLKNEGARIAATVTRLSDLSAAIAETTQAFEEQVQVGLLVSKLRIQEAEARIAHENEKIGTDEGIILKNRALVKQTQGLRKQVDAQRIALAARLKGVPAHGEKERLESILANANTMVSVTLEKLTKALWAAGLLENSARRLLKAPIPELFPILAAAVTALGAAVSRTQLEKLASLKDAVMVAVANETRDVAGLEELATLFADSNTGIAEVYTALVGPSNSVAAAIASESQPLGNRIVAEKRAIGELAEKLTHLASGKGDYSRDAAFAVAHIRDSMPEAGVQVLCDLVEPVSEAWQQAIEGYMGNARFCLIVKPEWERMAIDSLHAIGSRASVVQGKHCLDRADESRVSPDSIIHELTTSHPIAKAYLIDQFGSVVKVRDSEQLRSTPRGITQDGKGSGSRTMYSPQKQQLVLGRLARERALELTKTQLEAAKISFERLGANKQFLDETLSALSSLREPHFEAEPLGQASQEIAAARIAYAQLDLTTLNALEEELSKYGSQIDGHDEIIGLANTSVTLAEKRQLEADAIIKGIVSRKDERLVSLQSQIQRLKHLCEANPALNYTAMAQLVEGLQLSGQMDSVAASSRADKLRAVPSLRLALVRELLSEHNSHARSEERFQVTIPHQAEDAAFDECYGPVVALGLAVTTLYRALEGIGLYSNRDAVEKAERSFHDVFTKQFCVEILTKVDDGVRTLKQLNDELTKLKFGTDRFTIDWSKWEPEYVEYYGFFKAVAELADSPETVDLFGETELSAKHVEVRDHLSKLLLDTDQERAGRELLRIADYRNYRRYEIWNESDSGGRVALSTWGTGSGGQLETPAYIVRAAVVTNRMKLFEKGSSLKLLVSDESFSKMDEPRARSVLRYLCGALDLQVISAMPTRNVGGLRPEFDREYSYSRVPVAENGELDFILETDERIYKSDRMRELWEAQRTQARDQAKLNFDIKEPPPVEVVAP